MDSVSAYLTVGNFSIWLRSMGLSVRHEVDDVGRPIPGSCHQELTLVFNTTNHWLMQDWMETPGRRHSGSVTVIQPSGQVVRVTNFERAFCLTVKDAFDSQLPTPFVTTLVISPERLSFGQLARVTNWPPISDN